MKILYAIQGTGNGHVARAFDIIPELQKYGQVDLLLSGNQCDIELPWKIKYRFKGMSFIFGKKGGVDMWATIKNLHPVRLMKEIAAVPVGEYDVVLNDFEPVVAWASLLRGVSCIGMSHQSAVLHPDAPKPSKVDQLGKLILKYYAPVKKSYGFHFKKLGNHVYTPVIRRDVRTSKISNSGHYTVYLPAYDDVTICQVLAQFPEVKWQVFSKHNKQSFIKGNIEVHPVDKDGFTKSMVSAMGILCTAGFETPAETLYLGKKLCVMPMKGQYEQQCNAALLKEMGIAVIEDLIQDIDLMGQWLESENKLNVRYADLTAQIIEDIIYNNLADTHPSLTPSFSHYSA